MENTQLNISNNISLAQIMKVISSASQKITMPVRNGVSFSHINGYSGITNSNTTSISKAMQINNMLAMLSKEEASRVQAVYDKTQQGKVSQTQFLKTMKEAMGRRKYTNTSMVQNTTQTQGLVLTMRV